MTEEKLCGGKTFKEVMDEVNFHIHDKYKIEQLQKENAELKAQIKLLTEKVGFWEEQTKLKEAQIEEYDRLNMFDIARTDELKQQIKKMKCCGNCSKRNQCEMNVIDSLHCDKWELAK